MAQLFQPIIPETQIHPLVRRIIEEPAYHPAKAVINCWLVGLDSKKEAKKLVKEFQTSFNSTFWELYLNKAFKVLGFEIDYGFDTPDFHLVHPNGTRLNVEAVTANHKDHLMADFYEPERVKQKAEKDHQVWLDEASIKLVGKIKDKLNLFQGASGKKQPYNALEHVKGNPFVFAIAPFDQHLTHHQNNMAINRVLFGIEPPSDLNDEIKCIDFLTKSNGARVDLGLFTNDRYKDISAVIFSTTATFSKALVQTPFKGTVRATRYREMRLGEFLAKEGQQALGKSQINLAEKHDVLRTRFMDGETVYGSDLHLCDASQYTESHLDGLHIYYNPFADYPLNPAMFSAKEVTHNYFDKEQNLPYAINNDGALVSRETVVERVGEFVKDELKGF
ncbi:MAG: hypothetical protein IE909_10490 [Campylobacterales bacterium]|nr:hypothetical protein [Campylobacterales bacterium]